MGMSKDSNDIFAAMNSIVGTAEKKAAKEEENKKKVKKIANSEAAEKKTEQEQAVDTPETEAGNSNEEGSGTGSNQSGKSGLGSGNKGSSSGNKTTLKDIVRKKTKKVQRTFNLTTAQSDYIDKQAEELETGVSEVLRAILDDYMRRNK